MPTVQPGSQAEQCDNGLDDDCDGLADAADPDCEACVPGASEGCTVFGAQGVCASGTHTCTSAGTWDICTGPAPQAESCCTALDEDCDGFAGSTDPDCQGCPMGITGASCSTGMAGHCGTGTQNCTYQAATCTYEWSACEPPAGSETTPPANRCNGVDDNCNGVIDEGTTLEGRVRVFEAFPQALMSQLGLGSESGLIFMNWDNHTTGYHAIWGLISGRMLSVGDAAATRALFNDSLGGVDMFLNDPHVANTDSAMFVPAGGFSLPVDHLFFFIDSSFRGVNLSTMQVSDAPISDLGIPTGGGGYLSSNVTAAAFISASDWTTGTPDARDMALIISSGQAWLLCEGCAGGTGFEWLGPTTNPTDLFTAGISPYVTSLSQIDSLGLWREPGSGGLLAMTTTAGQLLYTPLTSDYGTWTSLSISDFSCEQ